jgi:hypothetical protein
VVEKVTRRPRHLVKSLLCLRRGEPFNVPVLHDPFASSPSGVRLHGCADHWRADELCGARTHRAQAAVSHRTGHGRLVSRLAGQRAGVRPAARSFKAGENIHAWWWPAEKANAPAILYLHGVRWNLTGQLFRIEQLRAAGYSVLAIDYRGFGQSKGDLPSEAAFTKTPVWRGSVSNCCSPTRASA